MHTVRTPMAFAEPHIGLLPCNVFMREGRAETLSSVSWARWPCCR